MGSHSTRSGVYLYGVGETRSTTDTTTTRRSPCRLESEASQIIGNAVITCTYELGDNMMIVGFAMELV